MKFATLYYAGRPNIGDLAESVFETAEVLAQECGRDFAIMLDEIPRLIRMSGNTPYKEDIDFMWTLRAHMHEKLHSHYIITGSAVGMIERLYQPEDSPFHGTFTPISLGGIDRKSAVGLVLRMRKRIQITDDLVEKIVETTNMWPFYLQAFCQAAVQIGEEKVSKKIGISDYESIKNRAMDNLEYHFLELKGKIRSEQLLSVLVEMAREGTGKVSVIARKLGISYPVAYALMDRLCLLGYVRKTGEGEFKFLDPLFQEWFRRYAEE